MFGAMLGALRGLGGGVSNVGRSAAPGISQLMGDGSAASGVGAGNSNNPGSGLMGQLMRRLMGGNVGGVYQQPWQPQNGMPKYPAWMAGDPNQATDQGPYAWGGWGKQFGPARPGPMQVGGDPDRLSHSDCWLPRR